MTIDSANAFLVMKFALVLEFADDHTPVEEPRFQFRLYDEIGDILRNDSCLSRDKRKGYGLERVELALAGMDELALQGETPWLLPDGVESGIPHGSEIMISTLICQSLLVCWYS